MDYRELTDEDEELIAAAAEVLRRNHDPERHHVGAAVRAASGKVYAGVHQESPGVDVCAEWTAVGAAASAGERRLACVAAVRYGGAGGREPVVLSPCGVCRELLYYYGPEMDVIVPTPDGPRKVTIAELLPIPYEPHRPPEAT